VITILQIKLTAAQIKHAAILNLQRRIHVTPSAKQGSSRAIHVTLSPQLLSFSAKLPRSKKTNPREHKQKSILSVRVQPPAKVRLPWSKLVNGKLFKEHKLYGTNQTKPATASPG
jgi:hypothetical protein